MHPSPWGSARTPTHRPGAGGRVPPHCQAEVVAQSLQNLGRPEPDGGDGQRRPGTASGRLARLQQPEGCEATPLLPPALRRSQLVRGPLTGALTLADVQHAPLPTVAAPRARLPLVQEGERRVARMTPHPPSSPRRRRGGSAQPSEPWRWARDELKLVKAPLLGAPNVVVCKPTAGWRSAPA